MNYKQTLETAKKNEINVLDLYIAYEMEAQLAEVEFEPLAEVFETLCYYTSRIYLKYDDVNISNCVCAVLKEFVKGTLSSIDIWDFDLSDSWFPLCFNEIEQK